MPRWRYIQRRAPDACWTDLSPGARNLLVEDACTAAVRAQATIRGAHPAPGWASAAHSRDGKHYTCSEQTTGARPVWVWTGDVP